MYQESDVRSKHNKRFIIYIFNSSPDKFHFVTMALRAALRQLGGIGSFRCTTTPTSSQLKYTQLTSSCRYKHDSRNGKNNEGSRQETNWELVCKVGAAAGLTAILLSNSIVKKDVLADEKEDLAEVMRKEIIDQENR